MLSFRGILIRIDKSGALFAGLSILLVENVIQVGSISSYLLIRPHSYSAFRSGQEEIIFGNKEYYVMTVKVFLLGRPGSGKTTAFQYLAMQARDRGLKTIRFREYTILHEMFRAGRGEFQAIEYGGFDIIDFPVLQESAQCLQEQIQDYIRTSGRIDELLFLELARDDYEQAMHCFSQDFLQDSYFLFIDAYVETCIQRIHYRVAHPAETDGHYVSEAILRSYYAHENKDYMASRFKIDYGIQKEVEVIENTGTFAEFEQHLRRFASSLIANELDCLNNVKSAAHSQFA
jgi:hypothetical protein